METEIVNVIADTNLAYQYALSGFKLWFIAGLTFGFLGLALAYGQDVLKYFGLR